MADRQLKARGVRKDMAPDGTGLPVDELVERLQIALVVVGQLCGQGDRVTKVVHGGCFATALEVVDERIDPDACGRQQPDEQKGPN